MGRYTLAQVELFATELDREERASARMALLVARAAKAKPDSFKKIMREFGG